MSDEWARKMSFEQPITEIRVGDGLVFTSWIEDEQLCYGVFQVDDLQRVDCGELN